VPLRAAGENRKWRNAGFDPIGITIFIRKVWRYRSGNRGALKTDIIYIGQIQWLMAKYN